ncbi:hypothetical protein GIV49_20900, partial [Pseudomonas syringae]|nr:hypothetical protein [Pseudomonas syringae]
MAIVPTLREVTPKSWTQPLGDVMGKYTEQAKLAAVLDYRSGKAGLRNVAD